MKSAVFFLLILPVLAFPKTYYFLGSSDHDYNNPENWQPAYPGMQISEQDEVIIQSHAFFDGQDLSIAGTLRIELGETLNSPAHGIKIKYQGKLFNEGEIAVRFIENKGKISNGMYAMAFSQRYYGETQSTSPNLIYEQLATPDLYDAQENLDYYAVGGGVKVSVKRGFSPHPTPPQPSKELRLPPFNAKPKPKKVIKQKVWNMLVAGAKGA